MSFPDDVAENLLVKSARHCCICRKRKGPKIRIHHIIQEADGGANDEENGIPVCNDCHDEMGYDPKHPSGRKYQPSELKRLRDEWFVFVSKNPIIPDDSSPVVEKVEGDGNIIGRIVNFQPRIVNKVTVERGPDEITDAMALQIREAIMKLWDSAPKTGSNTTPAGWYARLGKKFGATSYKTIKLHLFDEVMLWIKQQTAMQLPKLRRTDNTKWRNRLYSAIYSRAGELGMDKQSLYVFATERLELSPPVTSLKDLGERNLKRLHGMIFKLPR